jgi:hypothetical protein
VTENTSLRRDDDAAARRLAETFSTETIDALIKDAKATGTPLDGVGGRLNQMTKAVLERSLQAEFTSGLHKICDRLHAEDAAAINILDRAADADIGLYTPHWRVTQIIGDRADRPRSRLPDQDSNSTDHCRCGERNIQSRSTPIKE